MPIALTVQYVMQAGANVIVGYMATVSGSYVTGGDTLDFTAATADTTFQGEVPAVPANAGPQQVFAGSQGGNLVNDYVPVQPSPNAQSTWKLKICAASTFGTELAASAYPAAIVADKINVQAVFTKFL